MDLNTRLKQLRKALDAGLIDTEEFERRKAEVLDGLAGASAGAYVPAQATRVDELEPGMEIGPDDNRFRLMRCIGGGGMGRVWLARDLGQEALLGGEHHKALKLVHPQLQDHKQALERLKTEAVRAADLSHEHIANVYGWRQGTDGWLFVIMEYLEGRDLAVRLHEASGRGLALEEIRRIVNAMAQALDYAHAHRVLHRDLKPANVFLCADGGVKLLDFGLAAELHSSASALKMGDTGGTCPYMARDIYGLACVFCEIFTGRPALSCDAAVNRRPGPLPKPSGQISDALWEVLEWGLAYAPEDRPKCATELARRLLSVLEPAQSGIGRNDGPEFPSATGARTWIAVAATAILGGGLWWWSQYAPGPNPAGPPVSTAPVEQVGEIPAGPGGYDRPDTVSDGAGPISPGAGVGIQTRTEGEEAQADVVSPSSMRIEKPVEPVATDPGPQPPLPETEGQRRLRDLVEAAGEWRRRRSRTLAPRIERVFNAVTDADLAMADAGQRHAYETLESAYRIIVVVKRGFADGDKGWIPIFVGLNTDDTVNPVLLKTFRRLLKSDGFRLVDAERDAALRIGLSSEVTGERDNHVGALLIRGVLVDASLDAQWALIETGFLRVQVRDNGAGSTRDQALRMAHEQAAEQLFDEFRQRVQDAGNR